MIRGPRMEAEDKLGFAESNACFPLGRRTRKMVQRTTGTISCWILEGSGIRPEKTAR